jgi:hypothetical protein
VNSATNASHCQDVIMAIVTQASSATAIKVGMVSSAEMVCIISKAEFVKICKYYIFILLLMLECF